MTQRFKTVAEASNLPLATTGSFGRLIGSGRGLSHGKPFRVSRTHGKAGTRDRIHISLSHDVVQRYKFEAGMTVAMDFEYIREREMLVFVVQKVPPADGIRLVNTGKDHQSGLQASFRCESHKADALFRSNKAYACDVSAHMDFDGDGYCEFVYKFGRSN